MYKLLAAIILSILSLNQLAFADFKLSQKVSVDGQPLFDRTVWVKGARDRTLMQFGGGDPSMAAFMPAPIADIRQCDLRQNIRVNERAKKYLVLPFFDSSTKPQPSVPATTKIEVRQGGTVTMTFRTTDTGERQQMFGFPAKHLIVKMTMETSKDSCGGASKFGFERDGWFVQLMPETANCSVPINGKGGGVLCQDRSIINGAYRDPGLLLKGTEKIFDANDKLQTTMMYETLDVSTSLLDIALFEAPVGYAEVNSEQSLTSGPMVNNMSGIINDEGQGRRPGKAPAGKKAVGIDFFSGSVSKLDQQQLRQFIAGRVGANGQEGLLINSQAEAASGAFANIIGVEVRSLKESGASKLGGLFGKVAGGDSLAKLGSTEAEVIVTLYSQDGKTAIATGTAKEKVDGKADDAVRAAISKALTTVLPKLN
jgi:hypothetical protein